MTSWEEDEDEPGAIKSAASSDRLDMQEQPNAEGGSEPEPEAQATSNEEMKVDTVEEGASDDEVKKAGERKLLALFAKWYDTTPQQAANQNLSLALLEANGITYEKFIGSDPGNEIIRDELFRISGIEENYPRFFLVVGADTTYVGDFEKIQQLNDAGMLTNEMLGVTKPIEPPQGEDAPGPTGAIGAGILHHEEEIIDNGDEEILYDDEEEVIEYDEEEEVLENEGETIYQEGEEDIIDDDDEEIVEDNFFVDEDGNEIYEEEQVEEELAAVGSDNSPKGSADESGDGLDDGGFVGGAMLRNPDETTDVENQNLSRVVPEKAPKAPKKKEEEKEPNCFTRTFYIPTLFFILLLIGAGIAVGVSFALTGDDDNNDNNDNDDKDVDTKSPQGTKTTAFDGVIGDGFCDFLETAVPSTIDQCACFGEIRTIPQDVQDRYNMHLETFILTIYAEYTKTMSSCAPENQALLWLASANDYEFDYQERRQRFTLAVLIASMNGSMWTSRLGWLGVTESCLWTSVVCNDQDHVTSLDLSANNVGGTLPREIVVLKSLEFLSLSQNSIEGPIPPELFILQRLRNVDLSFNKFTGSLPSTAPRAGVLEVLNVERNSLSGSIPAEISDSATLQELRLNDNLLTGSVPVEFSKLASLTILTLDGNLLGDAVNIAVCELRNGVLDEFVVDCPSLINGTSAGVVCGIPTCCSSCL